MSTLKNKTINKTLVVGASHADKDRNQKRSLKALSALTSTFCKVVSTTADATAKIRAVTPATPESVQLAIVSLNSKIVDMQHETSSKTGSWVASVLETQTVKECASRITTALTDSIVKSIKEGSDNKKLIKANKNMDEIIQRQDQEIAALKEELANDNQLIISLETKKDNNDIDDDEIEAEFEDEENESAYKKYLKSINK